MSQFIWLNQAKNRLWLKSYALAKRTIWILNCLCWKQKGRGIVQTFVWQPTPTPKNKSFQPSHSASWLDLMFISLLKKLMCWNVFVEFGHHALDVMVLSLDFRVYFVAIIRHPRKQFKKSRVIFTWKKSRWNHTRK